MKTIVWQLRDKMGGNGAHNNTTGTLRQMAMIDKGLDTEQSALDGLRKGAPARVTALLTTAFFTFVFYLSPTGAEIAHAESKKETRAAEIEAIKESTTNKKLAHRLDKLKKLITKNIPASQVERAAEAGFWDQLLGNDDDPLTADQLAELTDLRQAINGAYQDAIAEMDSLGTRLDKPTMPAQALERHQQARTQVAARFQAMMNALDALLNAEDEADQSSALQQLQATLEDAQFERPNAPFNPDELPFGTPSSDVRAPSTDTSALLSHLGLSPAHGSVQVAATQMSPQLRDELFNTINGPTPADLEHTLEAPLTDDIANLAAELNHNPVDIYTWVHNNIRYIPSYGSIQGAQMTLETKRGNAIDTASLLIALLRASGIPARYAYGTVEIEAEQVM
ncbi:MAG: transglutaminase domain-containing protein, partial [Parahaliea sp.]